MSRHETRRKKLRKLLKKNEVDALLVTNFTNVTYLTGFTGEDSCLLVTAKNDILISDFRFIIQLQDECPGLDVSVRTSGTSLFDDIATAVKKAKISKLGIEASSITLANCKNIEEKLSKVEVIETRDLVENLREIKDQEEIAAIKHAGWCAERAFRLIRASLRPDQTEKEVADNLEHEMRKFGASDRGFPSIIAVGPRAALPHAPPTDKKIGESGFLLVDWGACYQLYRSDLTRMIVTGKISPKLQRVYEVVLKAHDSAIKAIRPGVTGKELDTIARTVISKAGFGKHFGHSLGHGLGLNVHEGPSVAQKNSKSMKAGMVITIEPGIYIPGWGGVRIEDDILVTKNGHEVLTTLPTAWDDAIVDFSL